MKKELCGVLAAMVVVGVLSGCGGSEKSQVSQETTVEVVKTTAADTITEKSSDEEPRIAKEDGAKGMEKTEILVAAAASLKNAYEDELIPMFQKQYPGITVKGTYDSSGKLQTQIEEGLEADVFMSAATKQMKALDEEGLIASDTITDLLENKIVLIAPSGSEDGMKTFMDIVNAKSIALGDPASVPAGQYAQEALMNLGIWDSIQNQVSFGTNVTEVLNQVAAASAYAGIVYATDAASMTEQVVVIAEAPEGSLKEAVIYPVAVVKNTAHEEEANKFVEFLKTEEAIKVFQSYGFSAGN